MKKIILSMMLSLDGLTAGPGGDLDWFRTDAAFEDEMLELLGNVDGMLFGRRSYELLAQYWPTAASAGSGDAPGGFTSRERAALFAHRMNTTPKLVVSGSLREATWGPARILAGDLREEIARLRDAPGRDLVVFAGATLAQSCMQLDLVDEYRLMLHPLLLGQGQALYGELPRQLPLRLRQARALSSGVLLVRYERARA
jgi:dihydrofolate reductase